MSDFDAVLERLLVDPGFKAQLAENPPAALSGYRLAPDEVELLRAQVSYDTGGDRQVEVRTSKASVFGLLSPLAGVGTTLGDAAATVSGGPVSQGLGAGVGEGVGQPLPSAAEGLGVAGDAERLGTVYGTPKGGLLGTNLGDLSSDLPAAGDPSVGPAPVDDYRTRVDADGDGRWDEHVYVSRADGGVDIVVDANHDGRADFIGHDLDRDGLIDSATTDDDGDGRLESRWVDVNGDGWLDRKGGSGAGER